MASVDGPETSKTNKDISNRPKSPETNVFYNSNYLLLYYHSQNKGYASSWRLRHVVCKAIRENYYREYFMNNGRTTCDSIVVQHCIYITQRLSYLLINK